MRQAVLMVLVIVLPLVALIAFARSYAPSQFEYSTIEREPLQIVPPPEIDALDPFTTTIPEADGDTVSFSKHGLLVRKRESGEVRWSAQLDGFRGGVRTPLLAVDSERVYVSHDDRIVAVDVIDGAPLWRTPAPADAMHLSDDLLFVLDQEHDEATRQVYRCVKGYRVTDGRELSRTTVAFDRYRAGYLQTWDNILAVQRHESKSGKGYTLLLSRSGRWYTELDRQVVAIRRRGNERIVLGSREVIGLWPSGKERYRLDFANWEWLPGGGFIDLPNGGLVAWYYGTTANTGVRLMRFDPDRGVQIWQTHCKQLDTPTPQNEHTVRVELIDGQLRVCDDGPRASMAELLDPATGRTLERVTKLHKQPE